MYLTLDFKVNNRLFITCLSFKALNKIKKPVRDDSDHIHFFRLSESRRFLL